MVVVVAEMVVRVSKMPRLRHLLKVVMSQNKGLMTDKSTYQLRESGVGGSLRVRSQVLTSRYRSGRVTPNLANRTITWKRQFLDVST
jgi:hypothetical protein